MFYLDKRDVKRLEEIRLKYLHSAFKPEFRWTSDPLDSSNNEASQAKVHYSSFRQETLDIQTGDFVLVDTASSSDVMVIL